MSSVDCRRLLRSIFSQTQQCQATLPLPGMSGDFAHINYNPTDGTFKSYVIPESTPGMGIHFQRILALFSVMSYLESEFMTGPIKICLTLIGYFYYCYY